ncbi:hypothetical protein GCM10011368_08770 [Hyunsoonleella pacifica]|nr:hypothetical protein GCM10011368_08770 [Hyunsoonleella pacifica]
MTFLKVFDVYVNKYKQTLKTMKKLIYSLFLLSFIITLTSCSNSDDSDSQMEQDPEKNFASITINGDGFADLKLELDIVDIIDVENNRVRLDVRNQEGYRITFTLPAPVEKKQYTMIVYNNTMDNISSMSIPGSGIFLSKAGGTLNINEIIEDGDCKIFKGSINVEYDRQDNTPGDITVVGSFEIPSECN